MIINGWNLRIDDELWGKIKHEYNNHDIAPKRENLFKVFELIKFNDVKVVILGQDPYPKKGDANGIAFSVDRADKLPASLKNIYKELYSDLGIIRADGDLSSLVEQGVLLMNTVLTTKVGEARSHNKMGWQNVTTNVIIELSDKRDVIFVLFGKDAQKYKDVIDVNNNIVIETAHPSPLSAYRGFLGSKIFSQINKELKAMNKEEIDWS